MYTGMISGRKVDSRNEVYPTGISSGYPGYTFEKAVEMKEYQERIMIESSKTVEVIVNIEPVPGKVDEYLVRNTSSYVCY